MPSHRAVNGLDFLRRTSFGFSILHIPVPNDIRFSESSSETSNRGGNTCIPKHAPEVQEHSFQRIEFECAAVSDEFIAIGSRKHILLFDMSGECLFYFSPNNVNRVSLLLFSPSDKQLAALASTTDNHDRVLIISTIAFRRLSPPRRTNWIRDIPDEFSIVDNSPKSNFLREQIAVSQDESQIIISTNCSSDGQCQILLFKARVNTTWKRWEMRHTIRYLRSNTGLTGVHLYPSFLYHTDQQFQR